MATGHRAGGGKWESPSPPPPTPKPTSPAPGTTAPCAPSSYVTVRGGGLPFTLLPPAASPLKQPPLPSSSERSRIVVSGGRGRGNFSSAEQRRGRGGGGSSSSNNNNKGAVGRGGGSGAGGGGDREDCAAAAAREADEENCCCWGREAAAAIPGAPPSTARSFFSPEPLPRTPPASPRLLPRAIGLPVAAPRVSDGGPAAVAVAAAGEATPPAAKRGVAGSGRAADATPPWWTSSRVPSVGARGAMEQETAPATARPGGAAAATGGRTTDRSSTSSRRRRMGKSERLKELTERLKGSTPSSHSKADRGDPDKSPPRASSSQLENSKRPPTGVKQVPEAPCPPPRRKCSHKLQAQLSGEGPSMSSLEEVSAPEEATASAASPPDPPTPSLSSPKPRHERHHSDVVGGSEHYRKIAGDSQKPLGKPTHVRSTSATACVGTDTEDAFHGGRSLTTVPEQGGAARVEDPDDLVPLTLPRAESRSIVGSYARRCIPFRSASFSRVDLRPDGRCYVRGGVLSQQSSPPPPASPAAAMHVKSSSVGAPYSSSEFRQKLQEMGKVAEESNGDGEVRSYETAKSVLKEVPENGDVDKPTLPEQCSGVESSVPRTTDRTITDDARTPKDKSSQESGPGPPSNEEGLVDCGVGAPIGADGAKSEDGALYWTSTVVVPNDCVKKDEGSISVQLADKAFGNGDSIVRRVGGSSESPFIRSHSADNPSYQGSQPGVPPLVPLGARSTWEVRAAGRRPRKPRPLGVIRLDEESEEDEELVTSSGNRLGLTILKDGRDPFELSRGGRTNQLLVSSKSLDVPCVSDDHFAPVSHKLANQCEKSEEESRDDAENARGVDETEENRVSQVSGDEARANGEVKYSMDGEDNLSTGDKVKNVLHEAPEDQRCVFGGEVERCVTEEKTGAEHGDGICAGDETKDVNECVDSGGSVEHEGATMEGIRDEKIENTSEQFSGSEGAPHDENNSATGDSYDATVYAGASGPCASDPSGASVISTELGATGEDDNAHLDNQKSGKGAWREGDPDVNEEIIDDMKNAENSDSNNGGESPGKLLSADDPAASDGEGPSSPADPLDTGDSPSSPSAQSKGGEASGGEVVRKRTRGKRKTRRREEEQKDVGQVVLPATVPHRKTSVYSFGDDSLTANPEISQARAANGHGVATESAEAESQTNASDIGGSPPVSCGSPDITKSEMDRPPSEARVTSSSDFRDRSADATTGERKISNETATVQVTSSSQCDPVRSSASPVQGSADYSGDYSARNASPCPTSPLDSGSMSDAEKSPGVFSLDGRSPLTPRRYSKRPLRGPYAQMLEAEMKRPEAFPKLQLRDDLKFLEDLTPRSGQTSAPILDARRAGRAGGGHSLDDSALRNSTSSSSSSSSTSSSSSCAKVPPKRKVSAHIPYSGEHLTPSSAGISSSLSTQSPLVCHQRTTSSPSKLEGISSMASSPAIASLKPRKSTAPSGGAKSDPTRGAPSPPPPAEGPTPSRTGAASSQVKKVHGPRVPPQAPDASGGRTDILTRLLTDQMQAGGDASSGKDTRSHVAVELYETERSYVESLQILVHKYLRALKSSEHSGLIDSSLVDEIFFQVPEILSHHEIFLEELRNRLDHWDPLRQQLGDVFLHAFTQQSVIDTYASFINNWKHAKESIKSACQAKPAFARLLESLAREHKGKLAVDSLLIMPVQRIPRYELLIQRLLKHTEPSHPDHPLLVEAATVVRSLAQSINRRGRGAGASRGSSSSGTSSGTTIEAWADSILAGPGGSASSGGSGTRSLLRVDQVTLGGKERSFILFSDLLLIASAKRRSGPSAIRKASTMSTAGGLTTGLEGHKLKLLMRIPLEDLEVVRGREEAGAVRRALKEAERVQEDLSMVGKLSQMAASLHCSHAALDEVLTDLAAELRRRAAEASAMEAPLSQLPLALHTQSGSVETLLAVFLKAETRASWEEAFLDAKQKLTALSTDSFPTPEFLSPLPIRKTRAGLQFTCAAPTLPPSSPVVKESTPPPLSNTRDSSLPGKTQTAPSDGSVRGRAFSSASDIGRSGRNVTVTKGSGSGWPEGGGGGEVWVCNSDGYVGQVCVLSLQPEPTVASCNGVCNARILCISAVPAKSCGPSDPYIIPPASYTSTSSSTSASRLRLGGTQEDSDAVDEGNQCRSGDDSRDGTGNIQLDSSSSESDEEEGEGGSEEGGCTSQDEVSSPPPPSPPTQRPASPPPPSGQPSPLTADSSDELTVADPSFTSGSSGVSSCGTASSGGVPGNQATMWLGTEDGCIHVYHCGDNIRTKRNKLRIQHVAAVLCILYLDDRVYVSLANGDIVVYTREPGGGWGSVESGRRSVGSSATPVTRMIAVRGKLWCGGNSQIRILNPMTLVEEHSFEVCEEGTVPSGPNPGSRWAWCLAPAAPEGAPGVGGVWVSLQHSALLRLFSPIAPFPCLCSIDLTPAVGKMLASCDDIIRQHKAACLRVTALLTCQDLLWVGTSAGVILTLAMDRRQLQRAQQVPTSGGKPGSNQISQSAVNLTPTVTGLPHGHTGHVRFLTCVDMPAEEGADKSSSDQKSSKSSSLAGGLSALVAPSSILPQSTLSASPPQSYQGSLTSQGSSAWKGSSHSEEKPTKILVISGGDGYEDFRNSGNGPSSEVAGREDSTNHLLLWQV
ncbi:uncharacterized protein LOC124169131 [Ischnura elegans]|uniref:uncharacterized protein LOC124169131 n=1 Tax=Ischnura elegans TaxID=197161 RepID=UPI001ED8A5D8|nr:uncharacterized protein LOC124169131 [Ischnura elegans]